MYKLISLLLLFIVFSIDGYCQKDSISKDMALFIKKYCVFRDPNPTWQFEADSLNLLISNIIDGDVDEKTQDHMMRLYLNNSVSIFEDMTDVMRFDNRRFLSLISIVLYTDESIFRTFVTDAECLLELMNDDYRQKNDLLLRFVYLYRLLNSETLNTVEVRELLKSIKQLLNKESSNIVFIEEYQILYQRIENEFRQ